MADLFMELINSEHIHFHDRVDDHLDDPRWLRESMARWGLKAGVTPAELKKLKSLRFALRRAVESLMSTGTLSRTCLYDLNGFLGQVTVTQQLCNSDKGALEIRTSRGDQAPSSVIAQSFAEYVTSQDLKRLKICENTQCRWAFLDTTRNKSKKWCSSSTCGNLTKVRRFRAKEATSKSSSVSE